MFLGPPVAHGERFNQHRVQSSADLHALLSRGPHSCSAHPVLLLVTSLPSVLAGILHWILWSRWLPCCIFSALGVASCFFHFFIDWKLQPSEFWAVADKSLAYAGITYHFYLWLRNFDNLWCGVAAIVCISSLYFYFSAYRAYSDGNFPLYVQLHCVWHLSAAWGTILFAVVAQ